MRPRALSMPQTVGSVHRGAPTSKKARTSSTVSCRSNAAAATLWASRIPAPTMASRWKVFLLSAPSNRPLDGLGGSVSCPVRSRHPWRRRRRPAWGAPPWTTARGPPMSPGLAVVGPEPVGVPRPQLHLRKTGLSQHMAAGGLAYLAVAARHSPWTWAASHPAPRYGPPGACPPPPGVASPACSPPGGAGSGRHSCRAQMPCRRRGQAMTVARNVVDWSRVPSPRAGSQPKTFCRERIWVDSACLEMEEKVCLKLWVKLGCSPRCTQIVPKWYFDGQVAGRDFFNTRVRCDAHQKSPFSPGANLGGFGLLRNGGKGVFEIMGQAGVLPAMYPNSAKMALGWPSGRKGFFQHAGAVRRAPKVSVFAGSEFGWIRLA